MNITILLLLSIITTVEIIKLFTVNFKSSVPLLYVVPLSGQVEDIEYILRNIKWKGMAQKVILLNDNASEETLEICEKFCKENPLFILQNGKLPF
jgi:hypothetical protein